MKKLLERWGVKSVKQLNVDQDQLLPQRIDVQLGQKTSKEL